MPRAVLNTLIYTAVVMLGIPLSVYLASLLNRPGLRFAWFYRVMFFMPIVAMPAAIAMVWRMIYNSDFGMLNYLLSLIGIDGPYWIASPGLGACGRQHRRPVGIARLLDHHPVRRPARDPAGAVCGCLTGRCSSPCASSSPSRCRC